MGCLGQAVEQAIVAGGGWCSWADIMALALYHPTDGYYSGGPRRLGRAGDFYTAVSVGPLYGSLLAGLAAQIWQERGEQGDFWLAEQAAHDGQLCEDVLQGLAKQAPLLAEQVQIALVEPQASYRQVQAARLSGQWGARLSWVETADQLTAGPGLLCCNELLDALPVHRVQWSEGQWWEQGVRLMGRGYGWENRPIRAATLLRELERWPEPPAEGHITEIGLAALDWLRALGRSAFSGVVWIADYGLDAAEFADSARSEGTLRRYWQHRMDEQVLEDLGQADLTCHVNFTRLQEVAQEVGFRVRDYADQGRLLTRLALPWLQGLEGRVPTAETAAALRQFQTLTHPAFMGKSFRVLVLER